MGPGFEVGVFCFGIVCVNGVVVECPSGMYIVPEGGDGACSPRLAGAFMRPLFGFSQVYVLEYRPFFRPVSLEEFVPPYSDLGVLLW